MPSLAELARKFHCDKVERHGYIPFYTHHLGVRNIRKLLELGIGYEGMMKNFVSEFVPQASLRMWRDAFPHATIYGVDNQPECMTDTEERIVTMLCDQHDENALDALASEHGPFDVIIDDGDHTADAQIEAFRVLWPHVAEHGIYICEDAQDAFGLAKAIDGHVFFGGKCHDDYLVWRER